MGVDVIFLAADERGISDESIEWINKRMEAFFSGSKEFDVFRRVDDFAIKWDTLRRFYGPYYPRGNYRDIYLVYRMVKQALPKCKTFYRGDSDSFYADEWRNHEPDGDDMEQILAHYFNRGTEDYHWHRGDRILTKEPHQKERGE